MYSEQAEPPDTGGISWIHLELDWLPAGLKGSDGHKLCLLPSPTLLVPTLLPMTQLLECQAEWCGVSLSAHMLGAAYPSLILSYLYTCFMSLETVVKDPLLGTVGNGVELFFHIDLTSVDVKRPKGFPRMGMNKWDQVVRECKEVVG